MIWVVAIVSVAALAGWGYFFLVDFLLNKKIRSDDPEVWQARAQFWQAANSIGAAAIALLAVLFAGVQWLHNIEHAKELQAATSKLENVRLLSEKAEKLGSDKVSEAIGALAIIEYLLSNTPGCRTLFPPLESAVNLGFRYALTPSSNTEANTRDLRIRTLFQLSDRIHFHACSLTTNVRARKTNPTQSVDCVLPEVQRGSYGGLSAAINLSGPPACTGFIGLEGMAIEDVDASFRLLVRADFAGAKLRKINFEGAVLYGANFAGAVMANTRFLRADLRRAVMDGIIAPEIGLVASDLRGASLRGAIIQRADMFGARLECADLSGADLTGAAIDAATLAGAILSEVTELPAILKDKTGKTTANRDNPSIRTAWTSRCASDPIFREAVSVCAKRCRL